MFLGQTGGSEAPPFFLELWPHREGGGHLTPFLLCLQWSLREVTGPALTSRFPELITDSPSLRGTFLSYSIPRQVCNCPWGQGCWCSGSICDGMLAEG